uniref:RIN4 pathogenic type III effector avirulence factor Avr cleavage site domain-containing protein n=1 Tax=Leersia perrieri TaxID=77586 RepID=A0A0D9XA04_9ORYZ
MAQQQQKKNAHVPKFGNWDNDGNVPYTLYFENARKGKVAGAGAGKIINPNDPLENPDAFSSFATPSPSRDAPPPPYAGSSPYHRHAAAAGETPARRGRTSGGGGGGYSVEQSPSPSPLHPYSQSRAADYSVESAAAAGGLVANSRAKGAPRGNETPTRGSAVPRFGDWDSNPASADGYTHIFNKVREEKQTQAGKPPGIAGKDGAAGHGGNVSKQHLEDDYASTKCSCFGWCK